ncbi:MAG: hypothetical protein ICV66_06725 [Chitinophagaceae bacterium]|nr:hypothetical protein [Chitinophagaceae bacterium]
MDCKHTNESASIEKLQATVVLFKRLNIVLIFVITAFVSFAYIDAGKKDIIRTKGIIIEDQNGNERILIGAPVPFAKNRVRTDTTRAAEMYGDNWKIFRKYYSNYVHNTNGVLILDEKGFDRIALGSPAPDPNIGRRIGQATGIVLNDERGYERSGYGLIKLKSGKNRVVLGLDSDKGTEGMALIIDEDDQPKIDFFRNGKYELHVGIGSDGLPKGFTIYDSTGKPVKTYN